MSGDGSLLGHALAVFESCDVREVRVEPADLLAVRLAEVLAERDRRAALALLRRAQQLAKVEVRARRALLGSACSGGRSEG